MQLVVLSGVFNASSWKIHIRCIQNLSSRTKLLLLLVAGVSLSMLATGVVLRQRRRRYKAKSLAHVGGALGRQNTTLVSRNRSSVPSHRRTDSFPVVYVLEENDEGGMEEREGRRRRSRGPSINSSLVEYDTLRNDTDMFLSLSQNMSTDIPSDNEFYDVTPDMGSLISTYPSMASPGGVALEDHLSDSDESFESASETFSYASDRHKLYISSLMLVDSGNIQCRIMRTKVLGCSGDRDFLAKVHCIRLAFNHLLLSEDNRQYAIHAGRDLILTLFSASRSDPQVFLARYNDILEFVQDQNNWSIAEEELKERRVTCLNIYDVALDFMLMDAFDDLSSPPSALLSVIQNGWISAGIKQSMLNTAVWSILKAKRSVLKHKNGFMSKFYFLSETMSPVFAWGFLGTDNELKERCLRFKSGMMSLIRSMFSLEDVRYSSVELLGDDIMRLTRQTVHSLSTV